jgi:hypothetical protein
MAENIQRSTGRQKNYKLDRGGTIADPGPFVGRIMNNIDPTFSGRVQVYIEAFGQGDPQDSNLWRTVRYLSPFFGVTNPRVNDEFSPGTGAGSYLTNPQSYGMWFTPPDIGVEVLCFFVEGDPTRGYYVGCVPPQAANRMVPAIGATPNPVLEGAVETAYFGSAPQMPTVEINTWNDAYVSNPKFFDISKPIHNYVAGAMTQQGIINDVQRGPISSSSQRDTPSTTYGVITPGRPIYNGGLQPETIREQLNSGELLPKDVKVIARQGGHSLVMDDGDLVGADALVRIRTAKGHQIMMNDEGNFFQILHANGQTWIEFGVEGTVDVFSTNSVNVRTQGTINLHADKDINMYAGGNIHVKSKTGVKVESQAELSLRSVKTMSINTQAKLDVLSDGSLAIKSSDGAWSAGGGMKLQAGRIDLNGGAGRQPTAPGKITETVLDDTKFDASKGWIVEAGKIKSIVTRAPTHEPYPYHNQGVQVQVTLGGGASPPPTATPVPAGVNITRSS